MRVRQDIDSEWESFFLDQLYRSIQYWKMDGKDISDTAKLVKKYTRFLLE